MKKIVITAMVILGLAVGYAYAHNGGGYMGGGYMGGGWGHGGYGHHGGGHMMGGPGAMMGPGMMYGYGGRGYAACPGWSSFRDRGWDSAAQQQYLEDTAELRRQLHDKRFDYMEMRRNPATSSDQLAAIERDITDIQARLQEKAEQY